jgi:hypothetical protein
MGIVKTFGPFWTFAIVGGPVGCFVLAFWLNMRWVDRRDERQAERLQQVLEQYRRDMDDLQAKYNANVLLVEETQRIAKQVVQIASELSSVVVLNTQVQTRLSERIENNLFCPMVRKGGM